MRFIFYINIFIRYSEGLEWSFFINNLLFGGLIVLSGIICFLQHFVFAVFYSFDCWFYYDIRNDSDSLRICSVGKECFIIYKFTELRFVWCLLV
jgi:hypothetical protein